MYLCEWSGPKKVNPPFDCSTIKKKKKKNLLLACNVSLPLDSVCQWFRRVAYDDECWRMIDLTSRSYSNRTLLKFCRRFPRDGTERLKLSGIAENHRSRGKLMKPPPFTEQLAGLIRSSYPHLRHLHISRYDFRDDRTAVKNVTYLPAMLQGLHLQQCELPASFFFGIEQSDHVPDRPPVNLSLSNLEVLSFEGSSGLGLAAIKDLAQQCPNLMELNLNGCLRLTRSTALADILMALGKTLRRLRLQETGIDDDALHGICRTLKRLQVVDIRSCKNVTSNMVANLLTLKQLKTLIADESIQILYDERKSVERL